MKTPHISLLMAGLLAVAVAGTQAQAQSSSASGTSDVPTAAGEASTTTRGVPNAVTTNSPGTEAPKTREMVRQETQGMGAAAATTMIPGRAGEATTMTNGQPNMNPMANGQPNMNPSAARYVGRVGVPATLPAGSLSVFEGGTPQ